MIVVWVVAGLALLAVELHTVAFYAVFLAAGSFAGAILLIFVPDSPISAQATVVAVAFLAGTLALRPWMSRAILQHRGGLVSRGVHGGLVGQEALTLDTIGDEHHPGHVLLASERWLAVTDAGQPLSADQAVGVAAVRGTTLLVRPLARSAEFEEGGVRLG
jgi:membrane protein implicated in regulation of membrane protease activity